ncbi:MAG: M1 family aminopeptidase [Flavobacteriales bacterium]|nr:M1 family aminopeptidase [Flavobacteriales bacterium]MCX7769168.1 M1 family aminopeptidase [Flavobacteriales bacterium]MDW8410296.1 M1 family aminopeptidase [Flavobacteriales bacterium]
MRCLTGRLHAPQEKSLLSDSYDVLYHRLELELSNTSTYIPWGRVTTIAKVVAPLLDVFEFELHENLSVDSVFFNGFPVPVTALGPVRHCTLPITLSTGDTFQMDIFYHGQPPASGGSAIGAGINAGTSPTWGNHVVWTLSQPYAAYHWWPCKQSLNDKIDSVDIIIITADTLRAGSNGLLVSQTTLPGQRKAYHWSHRYPIAYYLISAAVARYVPYVIVANQPNGPPITILNYVYDNPQTLPYWQDDIDRTADFMETFAHFFGPYPFPAEKYGHCMAPLGGGMEHQTMTTQGTFGFTITSHELAHQWFGNYVTCSSWRDIWVNEGFATYGTSLCLQTLDTAWVDDDLNGLEEAVISEPGGSVYVDDTTDIGRIFSSRLTYYKGAFIIHTLRWLIHNDSLFFAGLRHYLQKHAFKTASGADFRDAMEEVTGMDLDEYFNQWYYGEGYPIYTLEWDYSSGLFVGKLTQSTSMPSITPLFTVPVPVYIAGSGNDTLVRVPVVGPVTQFSFPLGFNPQYVEVDKPNWIAARDTAIHNPHLAIEESLEQALFVVPNPARDHVIFHHLTPGCTLTVLNAAGQLVMEETIRTSGALTVDISSWPSGIYVMQCRSASSVQTARFVKF